MNRSVGCLVWLALSGCQSILGITQDTTIQASSDSGVASDAFPSSADGAISASYNDITSASFWATFDTHALGQGAFDCAGATFDGRYVYFSPVSGGQVARYDTQGDFQQKSSWTSFNATQLADASAVGLFGAVFDGQNVFLIGSTLVTLDVASPFDAPSSWSTYSTGQALTAVGDAGLPSGFAGATFDGQFLYLSPSAGPVVRYDTTLRLTSVGAWDGFDPSTVLPPGTGTAAFQGAVFDGRSVYFVPQGQFSGALKYDTQQDFDSNLAWSAIDTRQLNPAAYGFFGGAFDGHYVYFVPGVSTSGLAVRYDTSAQFGSNSSWLQFDTTTLQQNASGYGGAGFDGRYVYFLPGGNGYLARYDSLADFRSPDSWDTFPTTSLNPAAASFAGAAFDGRYLYLAPSSGGVVLRFDAKTPPSLPRLPQWSGSFL
jgi:hypothetical protein